VNQIARIALFAVLASPAIGADLMITKTKHTDAYSMMGRASPATDVTETTWIGKQRLRHESGGQVTIVRADLKKMYLVDTAAKTYSTLDLPIDLKKYIPAEMAPMMESMFSGMKVTVTPTTEAKKIRDWNATKYTVTMSMPMGSSTQEVWATKDIAVDSANYCELAGSMMSLMPGGSAMAAEWKKVEGFPVLTLSSQPMMGSEMKSKEELTAVEQKDAPEGTFDIPKGFTEQPFDFMKATMPPGGRGSGGH
jgi:hypothetical protein